MLCGTDRVDFGGPWVGFYLVRIPRTELKFPTKSTTLLFASQSKEAQIECNPTGFIQYYRPLYFSDEVNDCEPLPIPDKTKPDAVKKLAATALYIHFCNRVCRKFLTVLKKLCGFFWRNFFLLFENTMLMLYNLSGSHWKDAPPVPTSPEPA